MAENKNQEDENNNKGGILKIAIMGVGGLVLIAVGAFVGAYFFGGESTDPSSEISQIIEKKENPEKLEEDGGVIRSMYHDGISGLIVQITLLFLLNVNKVIR